MQSIIIPIIALLALVSGGHAEEKFKIPNAQAKELVGSWEVVLMGEGKELKPVPEGRTMGMMFKGDSTGTHKKGERLRDIIWGADDKGAFAAQWEQPNGNGDGIMGTWKMTEDGLLLELQEFEDGKGPGEDKFSLLMKRVG